VPTKQVIEQRPSGRREADRGTVRVANRVLVRRAVCEGRPPSRSDVASRAALKRPSVSSIVDAPARDGRMPVAGWGGAAGETFQARYAFTVCRTDAEHP
jgi:hypothetical protein